MIHKRTAAAAALTAGLFLFSSVPLAAGSFSDAVNSAKSPERNTEVQTDNHSDPQSRSPLAELLVQLLMYGWLYNNFTAHYAPYPYADGGKYIRFSTMMAPEADSRIHRFSADTAGVWVDRLGFGNESRFEGFFIPGIGPCIENLILTDSSGTQTGNVRIGGQISLWQSNPLSCAVTVQWSHWYGSGASGMPGDGAAAGILMRSFPFYPLVLEWKADIQSFDQNVAVTDSNLQIGLMMRNFELFTAWKYISVGNADTNTTTGHWNGLTLGIRSWF